MQIFCALIGLCLFGSALAGMVLPGPCREVPVMQDFEVTKYLGKWYPQLVLIVPDSQMEAKCPFEEYNPDSNGTIQDIHTYISRKSGVKTSLPRTWHIPNPAEAAKIQMTQTSDNRMLDVFILETDYVSYSLSYTCTNVNTDHVVQSLALTREQNPPESVMEKIGEAMEKHKMEKDGYRKTKQADCVMKPDKDFKV